MGNKQVCSFLGRGEFLQGNKMNHLRKTVNNSEYGGTAIRRGKNRDQIKGYMGPRATWNSKRSKEASWRLP